MPPAAEARWRSEKSVPALAWPPAAVSLPRIGVSSATIDTMAVLQIPFTIDLELVQRTDSLLRGQRLFTDQIPHLIGYRWVLPARIPDREQTVEGACGYT